MKKYLVTGGAGFIGSHLVEALLEAGHEVNVLDDLSSGSKGNIPGNVPLIEGCITKAADVEKAMAGMDGCFHLAAIASVTRSVEAWTETHLINQSGAVRVFEQAAKQQIPVVYASSAAVYGDNEALPLKEEAEKRPLSPYGLDKYACEWQAEIGRKILNLSSFGVRFFNIFGPRQDPSSPYAGVISIFMDKLKEQQPLLIYGDGEQSRDFVYVKDAVRFVMAGMKYLQQQEESKCEVVNVCGGNAVTITEIAQNLLQVSGRELPINYLPERSGDIRHSRGVPQKAKRLLNLETEVPLQEGLEHTWHYFQSV